MTGESNTPSVPRYMRCEPSEGKHVFSGTARKCDCGKRHWPPNQSTFVIPEGETWAVLPEYVSGL